MKFNYNQIATLAVLVQIVLFILIIQLSLLLAVYKEMPYFQLMPETKNLLNH